MTGSDTTAPVTAEDLRERLARAVRAAGREVDVNALNAIIAALAGDPGDLPTRMAAELNRHWVDGDESMGLADADRCTCGELVKNWQQHLATAAMSVRWGHAARQAAEVNRLHSWDGLLSLLDEHWPEDIFPTEPDSESRDPGPRIVSLLRWVERLRAELAEMRQANDFVGDQCDRFREEIAELHRALVAELSRAEKAEAERDALKAAIEATLSAARTAGRLARGRRVILASDVERILTVPENNEDAPTGSWLEDIAKAGPAIWAAKHKHTGGRANAEDCPACSGTNPPYPFICPGETTPDAPTQETETEQQP